MRVGLRVGCPRPEVLRSRSRTDTHPRRLPDRRIHVVCCCCASPSQLSVSCACGRYVALTKTRARAAVSIARSRSRRPKPKITYLPSRRRPGLPLLNYLYCTTYPLITETYPQTYLRTYALTPTFPYQTYLETYLFETYPTLFNLPF